MTICLPTMEDTASSRKQMEDTDAGGAPGGAQDGLSNLFDATGAAAASGQDAVDEDEVRPHNAAAAMPGVDVALADAPAPGMKRRSEAQGGKPKQAATGDAGDAAQSEKLANLMGATGLDVVRLSIRWRSRDSCRPHSRDQKLTPAVSPCTGRRPEPARGGELVDGGRGPAPLRAARRPRGHEAGL